jgi:hypothetical protein
MLELRLFAMRNGEWRQVKKRAFLRQGQFFEVPPRNGYQLFNRSGTRRVKLQMNEIEEQVNENEQGAGVVAV